MWGVCRGWLCLCAGGVFIGSSVVLKASVYQVCWCSGSSVIYVCCLFACALCLHSQGVQVPVLLPGAKQQFVPLSPSLSEEDRQVVDNVVKIGEGAGGGEAGGEQVEEA